MNEYELKEHMCEIGRRLYQRGFAAANDGNITIRLNDKEVLCTPTMVSKGFMKPEDICKVDYEGVQLAGDRKRTSEVLLHLAIYKQNPQVNGVVHCHPPHATAFAVAHEPIPQWILPEVEVFLGEVPLAAYETPGSQKFAETVVPFAKACNTILLANHGTVTSGPDLEKAYFHTEIIDAYCRILILARQLGRVNYFTENQARELLDLRKRFGYADPRNDDAPHGFARSSILESSSSGFAPQPYAFRTKTTDPTRTRNQDARPVTLEANDLEKLVRLVADQVLAVLARSKG